MSETFMASNGMTIHKLTAGLGFQSPGRNVSTFGIDERKVDALREFFQHERDEELGRWRWSENPDYVVYPVVEPAHEIAFGQDLSVMIFHEPTGVLKGYCRAEDQGGELTREYPAARAYFDAHPEPKPWHDATHGELWELGVVGAGNWVVVEAGDYNDPHPVFRDPHTMVQIEVDDPMITAGRRIYPGGVR